MKKVLSGILFATMLCGLLTVNAFAADYAPYTTTDYEGRTLSFSAAKVETKTLPISDFDEVTDTEATVITVQPGSELKVTAPAGVDHLFSYSPYEFSDGNYLPMIVSETIFGDDIIGYPKVDSMFGGEDFYAPCAAVSFYVSFDWENSDNDEVAFIVLGDGATTTEPTTPVEPEQPTEPTTPVEPEKPVEPTTPVEPVTPVVPDAPGTYTVKKGDTMGQISVNYYGSYAYHTALYKANSAAFSKTNGKLLPGMVLTLPETLGKATLKAAPAAAEGETLYTVKAGDTLGAIAKATYGDVMQYKAIFQRNADRLVNANTIYEGQVIVLPAK